MRIVLYDQDDFEPLTILEVPHWRAYNMPEGQPIRIAVMPEISLAPLANGPGYEPMQIVTIRFEQVIRNKVTHWLAVTGDTESALLLRAAFLPGQRSALQKRERKAFTNGFFKGLSVALG